MFILICYVHKSKTWNNSYDDPHEILRQSTFTANKQIKWQKEIILPNTKTITFDCKFLFCCDDQNIQVFLVNNGKSRFHKND